MKNKIPYLFPLLLIGLITSSCLKTTAPAPLVVPTGTFSGYFEAYHLNSKTNKRDTTFEWVTLTLSGTNGFTITGDTTVHAGSSSIQADGHGSYTPTSFQFMQFSDKTLPATITATAAIPIKYHLNGSYIYTYNGTDLSILGKSTDTLYVSYNLSANQEPVK